MGNVTYPITVAPTALAICTAARPTPPAAACTNTVSPFFKPPLQYNHMDTIWIGCVQALTEHTNAPYNKTQI